MTEVDADEDEADAERGEGKDEEEDDETGVCCGGCADGEEDDNFEGESCEC